LAGRVGICFPRGSPDSKGSLGLSGIYARPEKSKGKSLRTLLTAECAEA
jgi:hypothetical protein